MIRVDTSRTAQVNELDAFLKDQTSTTWQAVQSQARQNREKLTAAIQRLEELNGDFVVDEMETFRQLLIDMDAKAKLYERLLKIEDKEVPVTIEEVKEIAKQYNTLIKKLQSHESTIQKYLHANVVKTEKASNGESDAR